MSVLRRLVLLLVILSASLFPITAQAAPVGLTSTTLKLQPWSASFPPQCYDLRVEARVNGFLVATASTPVLAPVCPSAMGITPITLFFTPSILNLNPGDVFELTYLTRYSLVGPLSGQAGSLQLWYNGPGLVTDSTVNTSFGIQHLAAGSQLAPVVTGPILRSFLPYLPRGQWQSFGTWGLISI